MTVWPVWLGDLPTWITTIAVGLAAGQYVAERRRRRDESERESRVQASHLTAWAVTDPGPHRRYGVRVANSSGSTFHDVRIEAVIHARSVPSPPMLAIVPPGDYFLEFLPSGASASWRLASAVEEYPGTLRPLMQTRDYRVTRVRFTDNRGRHWITDDSASLRLSPSPEGVMSGGPRAGRAGGAGRRAP